MGGGSESTTELPKWYSDYAKPSLELANQVAQIGYVPTMGPEIAAFNPTQVGAMQQGQDWAAAFNPTQAPQPSIQSQLMPTNSEINGQPAYSSFPGYEELMKQFKTLFPGQTADIAGFSRDPVTGAAAPKYSIFPGAEGQRGGGTVDPNVNPRTGLPRNRMGR